MLRAIVYTQCMYLTIYCFFHIFPVSNNLYYRTFICKCFYSCYHWKNDTNLIMASLEMKPLSHKQKCSSFISWLNCINFPTWSKHWEVIISVSMNELNIEREISQGFYCWWRVNDLYWSRLFMSTARSGLTAMLPILKYLVDRYCVL